MSLKLDSRRGIEARVLSEPYGCGFVLFSTNQKASPPLRDEGGVKRCDSTEQTPLAPYEGKLSLSRQDERRIELGVPFEIEINHKASPPRMTEGGFSKVRAYGHTLKASGRQYELRTL